MATKVYAIYGKVAAKILCRYRDAFTWAEFTGGVPDPLQNRPATCRVTNAASQLIIEHDPRFNNLIKLISTTLTPAELRHNALVAERAKAAEKERKEKEKPEPVPDPEPAKAPVPKQKNRTAAKTAQEEPNAPAEVAVEAGVEGVVFTDVTDLNAAREILSERFGANALQTLDLKSVTETAKRLNVSFPNLK